MLQSDLSSAFFNELNSSFTLKLDVNLNIVVKSCLMHLSSYNITYYKYGTG